MNSAMHINLWTLPNEVRRAFSVIVRPSNTVTATIAHPHLTANPLSPPSHPCISPFPQSRSPHNSQSPAHCSKHHRTYAHTRVLSHQCEVHGATSLLPISGHRRSRQRTSNGSRRTFFKYKGCHLRQARSTRWLVLKVSAQTKRSGSTSAAPSPSRRYSRVKNASVFINWWSTTLDA